MLEINQIKAPKIGAFRLNLMPLMGGGIIVSKGRKYDNNI